jgi:hypothetical protein
LASRCREVVVGRGGDGEEEGEEGVASRISSRSETIRKKVTKNPNMFETFFFKFSFYNIF